MELFLLFVRSILIQLVLGERARDEPRQAARGGLAPMGTAPARKRGIGTNFPLPTRTPARALLMIRDPL